MRIATMAVPLSGNRGSSAMLLSLIENLDRRFKEARYDVFSYYPKRDAEKNPFSNVTVWSGTPLNLLLRLVPLSFACFVLRFLGVSPRAIMPRDLRAIADCDVYLAVGGTTFNDSKLLKVVFNVLCLLPAIFLRKRLVLYTQTLGPFKNPFNRLMAKLTLPRAALIIGRGRGSYENLRELNLKNIDRAADAAFSLSGAAAEKHIIDTYAPLLRGKKAVGVSPNSIVAGLCRARGIDHAGIFGDFINRLIGAGYFPVLIPHSVKPCSRNRHNNDLPIIEEILNHVDRPESLLTVTRDYTYLELRELIGLLDFYVSSRFHAMISALYKKRPALVIGWGHQKYAEVMEEFQLEEYVMSFTGLTADSLWEGFEKIVRDKERIVARITDNLPRVIESSARAADLVATLSLRGAVDDN